MRSESLLTGSELSTTGSYCFPPDRPTHPLHNTCTFNTSFMQDVLQQIRTLNRKPFYWFCGSRSPTINRRAGLHSRQVLSGSRLTTNYYGSLSLPLYRHIQADSGHPPPPLFLFRFPLPVTAVCCVLTGWGCMKQTCTLEI